jgi:formyltetrahydrofolate deformylase
MMVGMNDVTKRETAILRVACPDQPGIISRITGLLAHHRGNIVELEQFTDPDGGMFFMRVVWELAGFSLGLDEFDAAFGPLAAELHLTYDVASSARRERLALFASKEVHCLAETLMQARLGVLPVEIPLIISNHEIAREFADRYRTPFLHTPVTGAGTAAAERIQQEALAERGIDVIGLARYMRILSPEFVDRWPGRIVNIHHSFLPAFAGADPYRQAHERGVKIIGATAHFVTSRLDEGPIITQDTQPVSHSYSVDDLRRAGERIERKVFFEALLKYVQRKIIRHGARTVVFQ